MLTPISISGRVFEDLVKQIKSMSDTDNSWHYKKHDAEFEIKPGEDSPLLKQSTIFVYTMAEKSAKDIKMKRFIVYYLTVRLFQSRSTKNILKIS